MRSATVPTPGAVLTRLRRETATAHARVEDRLFPAALASRASYARMLRAMLGLHAPLERQLSSIDGFGALGIDLSSRRKTHRLRADLATLSALDGTTPAVEVRVTSLPAALGAFYVLEGSTLGGRVLRTEVAARLGDVPTTFLAGYGDDTGRRWRQTRAALVAVVQDSVEPLAVEAALVDGAARTFAAFDRLLDAEGWPLPAGSRSATAHGVPA
jgi:heme oxygenase